MRDRGPSPGSSRVTFGPNARPHFSTHAYGLGPPLPALIYEPANLVIVSAMRDHGAVLDVDGLLTLDYPRAVTAANIAAGSITVGRIAAGAVFAGGYVPPWAKRLLEEAVTKEERDTMEAAIASLPPVTPGLGRWERDE